MITLRLELDSWQFNPTSALVLYSIRSTVSFELDDNLMYNLS